MSGAAAALGRGLLLRQGRALARAGGGGEARRGPGPGAGGAAAGGRPWWPHQAAGVAGVPAGAPAEAEAAAGPLHEAERDRGAWAGRDPFGLVAEEARCISQRLRMEIKTEVPALGAAAEYFFRDGVEGKRMRSSILLLLASSVADRPPDPSALTVDDAPMKSLPPSVRRRQQRIAEITEMIHVASLLHDDVIDRAKTRRGIQALNVEMGNKLAILAGDFLLARASSTLASLQSTEAVSLLSTVIEHLVAGEVMQMSTTAADALDFDRYCLKTFYKTASMMAHSAKATTLLGGHPEAVNDLAYDYGKHVGLAFQYIDDVLDFTGDASILGKPVLNDLKSGIATAPVLFAAREHPELVPLVHRKFRREGDVSEAAELVLRSGGIEKTRAMAEEHAGMAIKAICDMPAAGHSHASEARDALVEIARRVLLRKK